MKNYLLAKQKNRATKEVNYRTDIFNETGSYHLKKRKEVQRCKGDGIVRIKKGKGRKERGVSVVTEQTYR
ncbi:hypothetical protein O9929_25430 [Vibrio lentus]|nr:hypothetical protein [Vibrio lentus]